MAQVTVQKRGKGSVYKGINNIQGPSHLDSFNSVAANELAASEPLSSKNLDVLD